MTITHSDEADVVRLLGDDVAATIGDGHDDVIRSYAAKVREFRHVRDEYFDKVVEDVQQYFHDVFIDTTWPACPLHQRHPLWYHDGYWVCEQTGTRVAPLGRLRDGLGRAEAAPTN